MNRLGFLAASIGASLAIAALALSSPMIDKGGGLEPIPIADLYTEHITPESDMLEIVWLGQFVVDEPELALVSTPVEPVPQPPLQIGKPFGITPMPADRYLC